MKLKTPDGFEWSRVREALLIVVGVALRRAAGETPDGDVARLESNPSRRAGAEVRVAVVTGEASEPTREPNPVPFGDPASEADVLPGEVDVAAGRRFPGEVV